MSRPDLSLVPAFYHNYIQLIQEDDLDAAFTAQKPALQKMLQDIPAEKHGYRYAPGKWDLKEMLQHMIDAERIFCYRALCFARKDQTSLPGFDENVYVENSFASQRTWQQLADEMLAVRKATVLLFQSFNQEQLQSRGVANGAQNYVLGWGYISLGHVAHHMKIIKERYL